MKKYYLYIVLSLFISLFIYVFYRVNGTVINKFVEYLLTAQYYHSLKSKITGILPLNQYIVYSLPEGLWVFCATLLSKDIYIKIFSQKITLKYFPLVFAIGLELLQLLHLTPGTFDFIDILSSLIFWTIAIYLIKSPYSEKHLSKPIDYRTYLFFFSYGIIYFAHVIR